MIVAASPVCPIYRADAVATVINRRPVSVGVIVAIQPAIGAGQVSIDVWDLTTAHAIQKDKEALAAEYERDGDQADRNGCVGEAAMFRRFASDLLTQAADLAEVLAGVQHKAAA